MSESCKQALLLIAITVCLVLVLNPNALSSVGALGQRRSELPRRVLSQAEMQQFTTTANSGEIVMVGANGVLIDQGTQAVRVGTADVSVITNNAERVRVLNNGNVGIGTTAPNGNLHVRSTSTSGDVPATLALQSSHDLYPRGISQIKSIHTGTFGYGTALGFFTRGDSGSDFNPNNLINERMRIDMNGNVGIGTTAPSFKTSIVYDGQNDSSTSSKYNFGLELSNTVASGPNNRSNLILFTDGNSSQGAIGGYRMAWSQHYLGGLQFLVGSHPTGFKQGPPLSTAEASGSLTEAMRIDPYGNVGIGTTNPYEKLHVNGNICLGEHYFTGQGTGKYIYAGSTIAATYAANSITQYGNGLFINAGDLQSAQWAGNSYAGDMIIATGSIRDIGNIGNQGGNYKSGDMYFRTGEVAVRNDGGNLQSCYPGSFLFYTGGVTRNASGSYAGTYNERLRIDGPTGNVGIGTNNPQSTLHVNGQIRTTSIRSPDGNWFSVSNGAGVAQIYLKGSYTEVTGSIAIFGDTSTLLNSNGSQNTIMMLGKNNSSISGGLRVYEYSYGGSTWPTTTIRMQYIVDWAGFNFLEFNSSGIYVNGSITAGSTITQNSDITLKKNIEPLSYGLQTITSLRPVKYHFNEQSDNDNKHLGLIAQEVQEIVPEIVGKGNDGKLTLSYTEIVPILINAIKELQQQNQDLATRLQRLESLLSR